MTQQLGRIIGKIKVAMKITNDHKEISNISLWFDFTTASNDEITGWLGSNRAIAFQRPARSLTKAEIDTMDGKTIIATNAGCKVKSESEQVAELTAVGIPESLALFAVRNPDKFQAIMADVSVQNNTETDNNN